MVNAPAWHGEGTEDNVQFEIPRLKAKPISRFDIQRRRETDPIMEVLPRDAQEEYVQISFDIRKQLVDGLRDTMRWQDLQWNGKPRSYNPEFRENDLDHVVGLLEWANMIERDYPALYAEISGGERKKWLELLTMIVLHDVGETKGLGDVALTNQGTEMGKRKKRLEPKLARRSMKRVLPSDQYERLVQIYNRYDMVAAGDKVAKTAKFLDKAQASGHVARDIISFNLDKPDYVEFEFSNNLPKTLHFATLLMDELKTPGARVQLQQFIHTHVIEHFDVLDNPDIANLREMIRERFPVVFSVGID